MEKIIYLVRHGQASAGTHNYDRLSDVGKIQARLIGEHWKTCELPPTEAFTGTLQRQRDTAILAGSITTEDLHQYTHLGLDEYDHKRIHAHYSPTTPTSEPGSSQDNVDSTVDLTSTTTFNEYAQIISNWINSSAKSYSDGESWEQFKLRTQQAVIDCAEKSHSSAMALYTSGGAISAITSQIEQLPDADIARRIWTMHNASITTLVYQAGQLRVQSLNDIGHLEKHENPSLLTLI